MRPDGDKEAPGALARPAWGEEGAPACAIVPDGGMKASQGNRPPRAAFTHPAGVAMRRKTGTPARATMPGRAFHCGGREGENPPHRPPGNGWGENRRPRPCYAEEPGAPYGREAPVRWRVTAGERFGTPLAAIVPARENPAGGVHASDCMRPGRPVGFGGRNLMEPDHIPAGHQAADPAVDDQASDLTPGVTVEQGQCRVLGPQVCGRPGLAMQHKQPGGVDMPPPYSRKGLRGWMTNVSIRFPYKEKRQGKITEIGLTRLTSTPLSPTGSRAEACQPLGVIRAAWRGHDHGRQTDEGESQGPGTAPISLYRKEDNKNSSSSLIGTFRKNRRADPQSPFVLLAGVLGERSSPRP